MPLRIGTSGWQYAHWRDGFYAGVPQRRWFEHVTAAFATVELNVSFYRLPRREVFAGWRERSPADEVIAVKASRYLTHVKRLADPQPAVSRLMERASALGDKLGPVLLQLPPDLPADAEALDAALAAFPPQVRLAVEPRHESWWADAVRAVLARRGAALVWADRDEQAVTPLWRTASFGYLRLHHGLAAQRPGYTDTGLQAWVDRIATTFPADAEVFVYFNNDPGQAAVRDAVTFARLAGAAGCAVTRSPAASAAGEELAR